MPSLLDITPLSKTVTLTGGQEIEFFGLSVREIAGLIKRFPDLQMLLGSNRSQVDAMAIADMFPDFAAAAIAASAHQSTPEDEEAVGRWSGADQAIGLAAFAELSLPKAIAGPFAELLAAPATLLQPPSANSGKAPDTSSPPPSTN